MCLGIPLTNVRTWLIEGRKRSDRMEMDIVSSCNCLRLLDNVYMAKMYEVAEVCVLALQAQMQRHRAGSWQGPCRGGIIFHSMVVRLIA